MFDISGKVALVTGGASGIGLSSVEQLLEHGLKGATIADVNEELGKRVVENLNEKCGSGRVLFAKLDVTSRSEFRDVFAKTIAVFGNLDIVVNSAAIVMDLKWEEEIAVNLGGTITGTYLAFEEFLPKHKTGSEGVIINISSIRAIDPISFCPVYTATKSGVLQFSRCYGLEVHYKRHPVRVMTVCPGATDTPLMVLHENRHLSPDFTKLKIETAKMEPLQPTTHVAKCIIFMIREGKNGSAWVVENNEAPYQLKFPCRQDSKN